MILVCTLEEGRVRKLRFDWVCCAFVVATAGCQVSSRGWNGMWKLDLGKSSYPGQILTISNPAEGEYRFDESSSHTIHCDGKDHTLGNNRTLVCVRNGVTTLDISLKENGAKTRATHDELSSDGKAFTTTVTEFRPGGPTITSQIVFSRLSGSDGFAGRWRDISYLQQHAEMALRLEKQTLHIDYPNAGQHIDAPLDGSDAPILGPGTLTGATYAVRLAGHHKFVATAKRNGKLFTQGSLELSNDGRTITDSWWNPDRPDIKGVLLYEKQGEQ
jgi:hypothetical protein